MQRIGLFVNRFLGIDQAVAYTLLNQFIQAAFLPLSVFLVAVKFSPEMQGYFYTFTSILALQTLFELGLGQCIIQFASHEMARLWFEKNGVLSGNPSAEARLLSLGRLAFKWYALAALVFLMVVGIAGSLFFGGKSAHDINWLLPWWLLCTATALTLVIQPFWSLLEGCNQIPWLAKTRTISNVARLCVFTVAISLGAGLFTASLAVTTYILINALFLSLRWRDLLFRIAKSEAKPAIDWRAEIWPLQWRIALSWIGGFLSFSLFNPVIFWLQGPVAAGQFGMTWSLIQAVVAFAIAWGTTKLPQYGMLISENRFSELDALWLSASARSVFACAAGCAILLGMIFALNSISSLGARLLPPLLAIPLLLATVLNQVVFSQALYLRAHKKEPFLVLSLVGGFLSVVGLFLGTRLGGVLGAGISYLTVTILGTAAATAIFASCRRSWHATNPAI